MKKINVIFSLLFLAILQLAGGFDAYAQGRLTAKGTVIDADAVPVVGAYVVEKGNSHNGTVTDADGRFTINVDSGATLEISCIGYVTQQVAASSAMTCVSGKSSGRFI